MFFFIILSGYQNLDFLFSTVYMYIRFLGGFFWSCKFCENEVNLLCFYFCGPLYFIVLFFWCNKRRIIAQNGSPLAPHPHGKNETIVFWPLPFTYPSLYKRRHVCPTNDHPRKTIPIKGNSIWRKLRHWTARKIQYF